MKFQNVSWNTLNIFVKGGYKCSNTLLSMSVHLELSKNGKDKYGGYPVA